MELIMATNNPHKVEEIRSALPEGISIRSLKEAGIDIEIEEPYDSLEKNAAEKARVIRNLTNKDCFSEDTGLEVKILNNEPGVRSARYAGDNASYGSNTDKLLKNLEGQSDRSARFRTIICLLLNEKEYYFEGICEGRILEGKKGEKGFGYDPVFQPEGADKSFAEMNMEEKNKFSHRSKAVAELVAFLKQINK
jgi:XTP/dITP diphosphohydrolase